MRAIHRPRTSLLDLAPVAIGTAFLLSALVFHLWWWRPVAALLPHAPDAFISAFTTAAARQQQVLFPLGMLTTVFTIIVLVQEGAHSLRGRLRIGAVIGLVVSALISTAAAAPIEEAIIGTAAPLSANALAVLTDRWAMWQWINLGLDVAVGLTLIVAHRLPVAAVRTHAGSLTGHHRTVLFLLGAVTLFEGYDRFIASLALPYIGRDLHASEGELGYALSTIRVGSLLSILLGRIADRFGRRRTLLCAVVAYTIATGATGLSRGLAAFIVFQLVATVFLTAELALAQVIIAEEFPAAARGRGQGMLGAFAALGSGVAALLFPIMQKTPLGWRGLYFVGILPLLLVAYLQRALPETRRWHGLQAGAPTSPPHLLDVLQPGLRLRFAVLMMVAASASLVAGATFGFTSYRAINTFHWTARQVSTMMVAGGGLGLSGWFLFGRLADSVGRRIVGAAALLGAGLAVMAYYRTSWLLPSFAAIVFMEAGAAISLNSLGTELFPTALRATAKAWITNAGILGAMLGLAVVGATSDRLGGADVVISLLAVGPLLSAPLLFLLPETTGQELETISGSGDVDPQRR